MMAGKPTFETKFRRRREGKTNYKKRLAMLKSGKPRLVIRNTNTKITAQVIEYARTGDRTIASALSSELKKYGWKGNCANTPAAYLTGFLCAKKAIQKGTEDAVADIGIRIPVKGSRPFAAVKGAIDAGLGMNAGEKIFPKEDRITGRHIKERAEKAGGEVKEVAEKTPEIFEHAKQEIAKKFGTNAGDSENKKTEGV